MFFPFFFVSSYLILGGYDLIINSNEYDQYRLNVVATFCLLLKHVSIVAFINIM